MVIKNPKKGITDCNLAIENSLLEKIEILEKGFDNSAAIHSISSTSKFGGDLGWVDEKVLNYNQKKL